MTAFPNELLVSPMPDGRRWCVQRDFAYITRAGEPVVVPAGYITDFASVPRLFWHICPPWGKYGRAAVVHDWLCDNPGDRTQKQIDGIFLEAMEALGVPWWRRKAMYRAVRIFQTLKGA